VGPDRNTHLRNIAIIVLLAVVVWRIQAGRQGADAIANLLTVIFLGGLAFLGYRLYMEHRTTLFDLEDGLRRILYFAVASAIFAIVATDRMWDAGGASILLWVALIAFAGFGVFHVITRYRAYD
jgi:branched-subunit amino acid transport protein